MLIRERMRSPVHCVRPLDTIAHARKLMVEQRVNQLPVVVDDRLVGIITDRDLRDAFPSALPDLERENPLRGRRPKGCNQLADPDAVQVEHVMTLAPYSLSPDDPLEDAAKLMRRQRIGAVPIVRDGHLVGILTRSDMLDAFLSLSRRCETTVARGVST